MGGGYYLIGASKIPPPTYLIICVVQHRDDDDGPLSSTPYLTSGFENDYNKHIICGYQQGTGISGVVHQA
ncbi:hypothetical protein NPIL_626041 [Nephila pilipes]|uniref:Uncharacterized protein n=1 Tax=Nephila pilipes TaxID=299642 RepID=A0A8X6NSI0_NEPPI|nr:hypothetical protein NPIL_626041 [Nephila pilipes]